jgi:hypothetical protein
MISGAVVFLTGLVLAYLKLATQLKFGNLGSAPNWVPPPRTSLDSFILGFPVAVVVLAGFLLLIAGYLGRRYSRRSDNSN